jgi:TPR repeat protein
MYFFLLLALLIIIVFICVMSSPIERAKRLHNSGSKKMQELGENDEKVLELYTKAIKLYKKSIKNKKKKEIEEAYANYARLLHSCPKSLRNYEESLQCLSKAVEIYEKQKNTGLTAFCYNEIGTVHYKMEDYNSAFSNYQKSTELNEQYAADEATMCWLGLGVEQDLPKAMGRYRKAALAGRDIWANIYALSYQINEYGKGNYDNKGMTLFMDHLHAKSLGEARDTWMSILTQSADSGWPPAQVDLWVHCRDNKEFDKGMPYLQKALAANFTPALFHMGYVYHAGLNNTEINYKKAQEYYEKAALDGFPIAQSNLGVLYYQKKIDAQPGNSSFDMAHYWFNISAGQGYPPAVTMAARLPHSSLEAAKQILTGVKNTASTVSNNVNIKGLRNVLNIIDFSTELYNTLKSNIKPFKPKENEVK